MSDATKAVFLSYAREDTAAAQRIAEALRSHGVEVWFDQDELRGGDSWDQKIRRQIADCALFLPLISQHTQERNKGYFRREWKLAVEQTHDMAEGVPFLVPVVADDTAEARAIVPPEFLRVQWTRLPGALPTPQFVEQIKRLLNASVTIDMTAPPMPMRPAPVAPATAPVAPPAAKSGFPRWLLAALGAVVLALIAYVVVRPAAKEPAPAPKPVAEAKSAVTAPLANDKSIAVLPFANMSEDKDANAYFADGIQEEILTNLALISELRVVSRTSVEQYRKTTKPLPQIARELGVTWVLEGSVFRAGNKVRVTGQLIHAATDEHKWASHYDRDLTDIFAIQSELAQSIASALQATISPREKNLLERRPTENLAAYDLYLKARDTFNREGITPASIQKQESFLQSAVELDPGFLKAWRELVRVRTQPSLSRANDSNATAQLGKAKEALDAALRLAPDSPDTILAVGIYYYGQRDYVRALEQFDRVARLQPNDSSVLSQTGLVLRRQGKWAESVVALRRASQMDPADTQFAINLRNSLGSGRRYDEAIAEQRRIVSLLPESPAEAYRLATLRFQADGSPRETDELFARLPAAQASSPRWLDLRKTWARTRGDFTEAVRLDRLQPYFDGDGGQHWLQAVSAALTLAAQGDRPGARVRLENFPAEFRARLELDSNDWSLWSGLARMEALLDHPEEAVRCARKATELLPESRDAVSGPGPRAILASVYAWTGDKDRALAELARLLRTAGGSNVHELKLGPEFFPLHGDPRFEALLNDPKNNAPLF